MSTGGYYDPGPTHLLSRHVSLVSILNPLSRAMGARLAALTGAGLVVLDEAIEHREGSSVSELVIEKGLRSFRELETSQLDRAVRSSPPTILVLGEGVLGRRGNRAVVESRTHLVCLRPSIDGFRRCLVSGTSRNLTLIAEMDETPGASSEDRLRAIASLRESEYRGARTVVDVGEDRGSHRLATDLVSRLERDLVLVACDKGWDEAKGGREA